MLDIFDIEPIDAEYIAGCYTKPVTELDCKAAELRRDFLINTKDLIVKIAYAEGKIHGYIHAVPSDNTIGFIKGNGFLSVPCLNVFRQSGYDKKGVGKALIKSIEEEALKRGYIGVAILAFEENSFMPMEYFKKCGYEIDKKHKNAFIMRKLLKENGFLDFLYPDFKFIENSNKVAVDIFYNPLCLKSIKEMLIIEKQLKDREDLKDAVIINIHNSYEESNSEIPSGLFIEGAKINGYNLKDIDGIINIDNIILKIKEYHKNKQ